MHRLPILVILRPDVGRRICGDDSDLIALSRHFHQNLWPKSRETAFKSDTFREILRPKEGLRMSVLKKVVQRETGSSTEQ